jgi:hypothetical protein
MSDGKTIFIRCSGETKALLKAIKRAENRSENSQVIHMIHKEANRLGISVKEAPREEPKEAGLPGLAERAKQASPR